MGGGWARRTSCAPCRALYRGAFDRFRAALHDRLDASDLLVPLPTPDRHLADSGEEPPGLASKSIVCFTPSVDENGVRRLATFDECQLLFELLNRDVSTWLPDLEPSEARLAARAAHIGQPVALRPGHAEAPTVLRLVVGARFFTIVGFPADGDVEAALRGEIADAIGALDKLELLTRHFARLRRSAAASG